MDYQKSWHWSRKDNHHSLKKSRVPFQNNKHPIKRDKSWADPQSWKVCRRFCLFFGLQKLKWIDSEPSKIANGRLDLSWPKNSSKRDCCQFKHGDVEYIERRPRSDQRRLFKTSFNELRLTNVSDKRYPCLHQGRF